MTTEFSLPPFSPTADFTQVFRLLVKSAIVEAVADSPNISPDALRLAGEFAVLVSNAYGLDDEAVWYVRQPEFKGGYALAVAAALVTKIDAAVAAA